MLSNFIVFAYAAFWNMALQYDAIIQNPEQDDSSPDKLSWTVWTMQLDGRTQEDFAQHRWAEIWKSSSCQLRRFIPIPTKRPLRYDLPRKYWVFLNRLRSGFGRYGAFMHRIGLSPNDRCFCEETQTPEHVLSCNEVAIHGDMVNVDQTFRAWMQETELRL